MCVACVGQDRKGTTGTNRKSQQVTTGRLAERVLKKETARFSLVSVLILWS